MCELVLIVNVGLVTDVWTGVKQLSVCDLVTDVWSGVKQLSMCDLVTDVWSGVKQLSMSDSSWGDRVHDGALKTN